MKNDLKLRLKMHDQQMTLWEIIKETDTYLMFRASITSGKKNADGTWDNVNQTFTCFANSDLIGKIKDNFTQKAKIKVSGSITMMPEKRAATGRNGQEYQESIFSNVTLNVDAIEFIESDISQGAQNFTGNSQKINTEYSSIDDDIPF